MKDFKVNIGGAWKDTDTMFCKIDGIWKTVESVWTKIDGTWVECKGLPEWSYIGAISNLNGGALGDVAYGSIGVYAVFYPGQGLSTAKTYAYAYAENLTRSNPTNLVLSNTCSFYTNQVNVGNYLVIAGSRNVNVNTVNAISESLVRSSPTALGISYREQGGAKAPNHAVFAGGYDGNYLDVVYAYSTTLVRSTPTDLDRSKSEMGCGNTPYHAVYAGGRYNSTPANVNTVITYNSALVRGTATSLSQARAQIAGVNLGDYAIFAGGLYSTGDERTEVEAFDSNLIKYTLSPLSEKRYAVRAASLKNELAVFAGGQTGSSSSDRSNAIDVYDKNLVKVLVDPMPWTLLRNGIASVGDYIIIAGGYSEETGGNATASVIAYQYK